MINSFDLSLLELVNSWTAVSPEVFYNALWLSDNPPWIIAACALTGLWFSNQPADGGDAVNRRQADVLALFFALPAAFVTARVLGHLLQRPRPMALPEIPLAAPIDPKVWEAIHSAIELQGAFPSDHGAMFAVVTAGFFLISVWAGLAALAVNLFFAALRVGIGFHWPTDMLAGELIGAVMACGLLRLRPQLQPFFQRILTLRERHAPLFYPLAFLVLHDFSRKFSGLFTGLHELQELFGS